MNEQTAVFNLGIASPSANLRLSVALLYVSRVTSSRDESIRCLFGHLFGKRYCKLSRLTCKGNFDRCFLVSFLYFHNFILILSQKSADCFVTVISEFKHRGSFQKFAQSQNKL